MIEVVIWILASFSYDSGAATVIDRFASEVECNAVKEKIPAMSIRGFISLQKPTTQCLKAKVVRFNNVNN